MRCRRTGRNEQEAEIVGGSRAADARSAPGRWAVAEGVAGGPCRGGASGADDLALGVQSYMRNGFREVGRRWIRGFCRRCGCMAYAGGEFGAGVGASLRRQLGLYLAAGRAGAADFLRVDDVLLDAGIGCLHRAKAVSFNVLLVDGTKVQARAGGNSFYVGAGGARSCARLMRRRCRVRAAVREMLARGNDAGNATVELHEGKSFFSIG